MRRRTDRFRSPALPSLDLPHLEPLEVEALADAKDHVGELIEQVDASGLDLSGATFSECEITSLVADETRFLGARFTDSRLTQVTAPRLQAARTTWRNVELASSRIGAFEAFDAELTQVRIDGSKLGWVNFRSAELRDVTFIGCRFEELDLSGSTLNRVAFEHCSVQTLVLEHTKSQDLDLRGLEFAELRGLDGLRGARVSEEQGVDLLGVFARHFGVAIGG